MGDNRSSDELPSPPLPRKSQRVLRNRNHVHVSEMGIGQGEDQVSDNKLPSPSPSRRISARIQRNRKSKISYSEVHELLEVSANSRSNNTSREDVEYESDGDEEDDEHNLMQLKVEQDGDGTNKRLNTLTESDIAHVKASRKFRSHRNDEEVHIQFNYERYMLAGKRVKYKSIAPPKPKSEAQKPKKPRKGNRTGRTAEDSLPEKPTSTISISAEIARLKLADSIVPLSTKHEAEIEELVDDISKDFPRWQYILRENFNIVLYGYGSKEPILQNFKSFLNEEFIVVDINGFFPKLNPKKLLVAFWEALDVNDELVLTGNNILGITDDMCEILKSEEHPSIYFLVHGLDRLAMNQPIFFQALCTLSKVKYIHIVASVDHINVGLGIGHSSFTDLNLFWINSTTFVKYEKELEWNSDELTDLQDEETAKSTLDQVLKSLTANARKAFRVVVTLQLNSLKASGQSLKNFTGVPFSEVSRKCREAFIAHGDMPLKTLLQEFVDHKLIRYAGKGRKVNNLLIVDLEMSALEDVLKTSN